MESIKNVEVIVKVETTKGTVVESLWLQTGEVFDQEWIVEAVSWTDKTLANEQYRISGR